MLVIVHNDAELQGSSVIKNAIVLAGSHATCSNTWCKYEGNEDTYRFKSLPHGKPLQDQSKRPELEKLAQQLAAKAETLACLGSTQVNESLNQTLSTFAPKAR